MTNYVRNSPFDKPKPVVPNDLEEEEEPEPREPNDDDLSDYYGGGGARPMSEQYREAAEIKRRLR